MFNINLKEKLDVIQLNNDENVTHRTNYTDRSNQ